MANALGSVVIEMAVNLARLRSDFGQAAQISQTRLREIQRSAETTVRQISSVGRAVQNAFATIGIGVGLTSIVYGLKNAALSAIEFGDNMAKAAAKTGVAGSAFSELAYAARQNDVQFETLTKAFIRLQKASSEAATGLKTTADAFKALGIDIDEFRQLAPDRQFEVVAEQLSQLRNQTDRARAGTELLGRGYQELAPLLENGAKGIRALREEAVRTGRALTEEQINKLADADLAIKNLTASWEAFSRTLTASVSPTLVKILDNMVALRDLKPPDWLATIQREGLGAGWGDLADTVRQRQQREDTQRRLAPGLSPELMRAGIATLPTRTTSPPGYTPDADPMDGLRDINVWQREVYNLRADMDAWMQSFNVEFVNSFTREVNGTANSIRAMTLVVEGSREAMDEWAVFAEQAARNMQDAFAQFLFDPFKDGLRGMLAAFIDVIRQMLAQYLAFKAFTALGNALAGSGNAFVAGIGTFLQGKAAGGPVSAGVPYMVGERGPELFVPRSSGTIIPNGATGGAAVMVSYNIDARGADADRIMAILPPLLKQTEDRTIARVLSLNRKGRIA